MKSNLKFFIKMFLILTMIIGAISMCSGVYAFDWSTALDSVETTSGVAELDNSAISITGAILSVCKYVATGIALIMIVIIAAKYMIASAGDRADIKKHAVAYVTGAVILFGSAAILDIIQDFATKTISGTSGAGETTGTSEVG